MQRFDDSVEFFGGFGCESPGAFRADDFEGVWVGFGELESGGVGSREDGDDGRQGNDSEWLIFLCEGYDGVSRRAQSGR